MTLHLPNFKSKEICVKVIDNHLVVNAEHEEKPDEHGHVYRHFNRRYVLPRNVDFDKVNATMSDDGTLIICGPKKPLETVITLWLFVFHFLFQSACVFFFTGKWAQYRNQECPIGGFFNHFWKIGEARSWNEKEDRHPGEPWEINGKIQEEKILKFIWMETSGFRRQHS